ncbi:hypothetical protein EVG20_g5731 [Dentipellis fragilis]|uniref:Uncharacterized protein n=1 Tax=Dentipellis fragilis TaxID=205917 RepID=A0A4Y9YTF0_9AGAM|nr:hypothetical protein EVG20_g5731 [Dentipellis fragilis]
MIDRNRKTILIVASPSLLSSVCQCHVPPICLCSCRRPFPAAPRSGRSQPQAPCGAFTALALALGRRVWWAPSKRVSLERAVISWLAPAPAPARRTHARTLSNIARTPWPCASYDGPRPLRWRARGDGTNAPVETPIMQSHIVTRITNMMSRADCNCRLARCNGQVVTLIPDRLDTGSTDNAGPGVARARTRTAS